MKRLWVAAALAPLSFAASIAHAANVGSTSTPQLTNGSDLSINSGATVDPSSTPATVTAVTINSDNSVTNNGAISITETTSGTTTNQGITAGPFANGGNRTGILVTTGSGADSYITTTSGSTISITGENSAGISVLAPMGGALTDNGDITVTGGNYGTTDVSYGIVSSAPIGGNVSIGGNISVTGANATGVALNGGVGGSVSISGPITATGYRSTTPPDLSVIANLTADQLAQGGPALSIGGNVAYGLTVVAPVVASGSVAATTGGALNVDGSAPALLVGGANPIIIGAATNGYGITIGGAVDAQGDYPGFSATGIQIGGTNPLPVTSGGVAGNASFAAVTLTGGIDISGNVTAVAETQTEGNGTATALHIGQGAIVPRITNSGIIEAIGENNLTAGSPGLVVGLQINSGVAAGGTILNNSGNLSAEVTGVPGVAGVSNAAGGTVGTAIAINDQAGALSQIINTGNITASIVPVVTGATTSGTLYAINENNTGNVTVTQCSAVDSSGDCLSSGNATLTPTITGAVAFGSGNATLNLWGGNLSGDVAFGNNTGNALDLENSAYERGALTVASGGALAVNIDSGELFKTNANVTVSVSTLHVGSTGTVIFAEDPDNPNGGLFNVAGNATLDSGAQVGVSLTAPLSGSQTFEVVTAGGTLSVGNVSAALSGQIPYLEAGNVTTTGNNLYVNLGPKTVAQLGLNPAETAEFGAFTQAYTAAFYGNTTATSDPAIAADILSKTTRASFLKFYDQFLPDYSGGPFEALVGGQGSLERTEAEPPVKLQTDAVRGWVQEIGYMNSEPNNTEVNGSRAAGFGLAGGIESAHGDSALGVAVSFLTSNVQDLSQSAGEALSATAFEAGVYWRKGDGQKGLDVNANLNGGLVSFGDVRNLVDQPGATDLDSGVTLLSRQAKASWLGGIVSAEVGAGYQFDIGRFYAKPEVSADYVALFSGGYTERGGGPAFDLRVNGQTSSQANAQADIVLGLTFGQSVIWRPELTLGYRAVVVGGPASTTAAFASGGPSFTLNPQFDDRGGFVARLGLRASGQYADFSADAGGVFSDGYQTYDARAAARFLF